MAHGGNVLVPSIWSRDQINFPLKQYFCPSASLTQVFPTDRPKVHMADRPPTPTPLRPYKSPMGI